MSNQNLITFELLLSLEKNIVVQRYFYVKDFNPKSLKSMDLHEYVKNICEEIFEHLVTKSSDFLCENYEYYGNLDTVEDNENKEKENFLLELKMNDEVFIQRIFPAHYFHPKIRYTVDIRPFLKKYLMDITNILSSRELETTYLNYEL
jgi:hypothetical protein